MPIKLHINHHVRLAGVFTMLLIVAALSGNVNASLVYYANTCTATGSTSASCTLPAVISPGDFCWGGDGNGVLNTPSWPVLGSSGPGQYAEVSNTYSSSTCNDSSSKSSIVIAGLEVNAIGGSPILNAVAAGATSAYAPVYSYYYSTNGIASGQPAAVALMVSCGFYECSSITWPSGCTQQFLQSGIDGFESIALALCNQVGQTTYNANILLSGAGSVAVASAVYSGGQWQLSEAPLSTLPGLPYQLDAGQQISFTAQVTGGAPPYTYQYLLTNTVTGNVILSQRYTGISSLTNTLAWDIPLAYAGNTIEANVIITDADSATANSIYTGTLTINPPMTAPILTPSNPAIDSGQPIAFSASWSGGTPVYGASLYSSPTDNCNQQSALVQQQIGLTSPSATFAAIYPSANTNYCVYVTDNALDPSAAASITGNFSIPFGIAFSPSGTYAYVNNYFSNDVAIIDTATNTVTGSITSGITNPFSVAFSPSGTYAYIGTATSDVLIVNTATNAVISSISAGLDSPRGIAFSPSGTYAYIANTGANNVVIVNTAANSVSGAITSGFYFNVGVAINPSGTEAYVPNGYANNVVIINTATNTITGSLTSGFSFPPGAAFSPSGTYAYVLNDNTNNMLIINTATNTIADSITSGLNNPKQVAFSPSGTYAYVTNYDADNVLVINTGANIANSINSALSIDSPLSSVSVSASNSIVDAGQYVTITPTITGGVSPYSANFIISNQITGTVINSIVETSTSPSATFYLPSWMLGNTVQANAVITDSSPTNEMLASSPIALSLGSTPNVAISPSSQQTIWVPGSSSTFPAVFTAYATGGTPPYTYNFIVYDSFTGRQSGNYFSSSNSFTFHAPVGSIVYSQVTATDSSTARYVAYSSPSGNVTSTSAGCNQAVCGSAGSGVHSGLPTTTILPTQSTNSTTMPTTTISGPTVVSSAASNSSISYNSTISRSTPYLISLTSSGTTLLISSLSKAAEGFHISITNITSKAPMPPSSSKLVLGLNISIVPAYNLSITETTKYNCSIPAQDISVYMLKNGNWSTISNTILDEKACTVTFAVPTEPTIEILSNYSGGGVPAANSTASTTASTQTTTIKATRTQSNSGIGTFAIGVATAIIIALIAAYLARKRGK